MTQPKGPTDHPLHDVWYACLDAGYEMNLKLPEGFAMHMIQSALELLQLEFESDER